MIDAGRYDAWRTMSEDDFYKEPEYPEEDEPIKEDE